MNVTQHNNTNITMKPSTRMKPIPLIIGALSIALLASCSSNIQRDGPPSAVPDKTVLDKIPNATPRYSPPRPANQKAYNIHGRTYQPLADNTGFIQRGEASWYGQKFHGRPTATGETYDMYGMTAAHKRLPLPSYVEVRNLENERSIVVRVNDRGPFYGSRIIDLSYAAAYKLGILKKGTGYVEVRAITPGSQAKPTPAPVQNTLPPAPTPAETVVYVQIGAFRNYQNAVRLQQRLQQQIPWTVQIVSSTTGLHRVQTGPIPNVSTADVAVDQLAGLGIPDAQVLLGKR